MNSRYIRLFFLSVFFSCIYNMALACQCPLTTLDLGECNKYEIIFKGRIVSVVNCDNKFGTAVFEVQELYKGNITKQFNVLFECGVKCAMEFSEGEEWIIYSNYKQIDNALIDWCSRSRKFFKNPKEDFYTVTYGNDYFDEEKFLQKNFGNHRTRKEAPNMDQNRNERPSTDQTIVYLLCSIAGMILFYWLFKKYFKF